MSSFIIAVSKLFDTEAMTIVGQTFLVSNEIEAVNT